LKSKEKEAISASGQNRQTSKALTNSLVKFIQKYRKERKLSKS
jgi:hypothetical protein